MDDLGVKWEELYLGHYGAAAKEKRKQIRDYQIEAVQKTHEHFKNHDRGKLIMACGTGKTFTSLRIAEKETQGKGLVLFLAPSIALIGQTLRKWMVDADEGVNIHPLCVCSDYSVKQGKEDEFDDSNSSIDCLVSTDPEATAKQQRKLIEKFPNDMIVVFSTYQSIQVVHDAQEILKREKNGSSTFDITICDEAHRTTGKTRESEDVSHFNLIHDSEYIKSKRRLYMTATPRLYKENLKKEAENRGIYLWSMDDEKQFGEEIYKVSFGEAVKKGLLADYKVITLALRSSALPEGIKLGGGDDNALLSTDDRTRLIGCINALSKNVFTEDGILKDALDEQQMMMKTAVVFCNSIDESKKAKSRKGLASKTVAKKLNDCTYRKSRSDDEQKNIMKVSAQHVDGTMSASERDKALCWLKEKFPDDECRMLTNVRCLSEGVDVPSLDAVIFLAGMGSEIDVIQAVG